MLLNKENLVHFLNKIQAKLEILFTTRLPSYGAYSQNCTRRPARRMTFNKLIFATNNTFWKKNFEIS